MLSEAIEPAKSMGRDILTTREAILRVPGGEIPMLIAHFVPQTQRDGNPSGFTCYSSHAEPRSLDPKLPEGFRWTAVERERFHHHWHSFRSECGFTALRSTPGTEGLTNRHQTRDKRLQLGIEPEDRTATSVSQESSSWGQSIMWLRVEERNVILITSVPSDGAVR
jgi:hypothetical protein